jgi:hypothetical protein
LFQFILKTTLTFYSLWLDLMLEFYLKLGPSKKISLLR